MQRIYILWNLPFFWVVKIGITGKKVKHRVRQIDQSAAGKDICIFSTSLFFAYHIEQMIHFICRKMFLQTRFNGSGKTERFLLPAAFVAIFIILIIEIIQFVCFCSVVVGLLYVLQNLTS